MAAKLINRTRAGQIALVALLLAGVLQAVPSIAGAKDSPATAAPAQGFPDHQLAPLSLTKLNAGHKALETGDTKTAISHYEAALAADPRNLQAYVGLARASQADGLPGQAVHYYREALELDPNDLTALELQGTAFLQRGARPRAEGNLERLQKICDAPCPQADRLAAAIADHKKSDPPKPDKAEGEVNGEAARQAETPEAATDSPAKNATDAENDVGGD